MNRATLVIMAAGIGSRFGGGIKQLEPVGPMVRLSWTIRLRMRWRQVLIKSYL